EGESLQTLRTRSHWPDVLGSLLHVAAGWLYFGKEAQARIFLDEARELLYKGSLYYLPQSKLAYAYVAALSQAPPDLAVQGLDEMFAKLDRVYDCNVTNKHFSLSQLLLVEAVVNGVVTEDFATGGNAR